MLAELSVFFVSLFFSITLFLKTMKKKDVKKGIMSLLFLVGAFSALSSLLYSYGLHELYCFKLFSAVVIPFGLLIIALLFLTRFTKSLLLLLGVFIIFSFVLALLDYYELMIALSLISAFMTIVLFSVIFIRTKSKKMLLFILSILLFTIGPILVMIGFPKQVHYFLIIVGLLILFLIFNK